MDGEQAARWAAAQERVPIGADLVAAALRQLHFLAAVDRRRWLYDEGPLLDRAIRRYKACWLPLLDKHTKAAVVDGPLVVPLDCEWIWHCHRLNPVQYIRDCKKMYGRILNNNNVESSTQTKSTLQSEKVWKELYPEEPFELLFTRASDIAMDMNPETTEDITYDLVSAVKRQSSFYYQVGTPTMHDPRFLQEALARYKAFLYLIKLNQEKGSQRFRVPTYDVDLLWHTHQLHPVTYRDDMVKLLGKVLEHDDTDADRSEGKKLDVGFTETTEQFESTFGVRYWKAGCMYRGNMPSPVTSTPQIFSTDIGTRSDICKAQKDLNALDITAVELYLQIVDIKNLPSAVPKENVYVQFTKNQSDMFISDGGRLDISTVTGKSTGVCLQCEPTGELILAVMANQVSKKPEPIGKVSFPLQDLIGPDSKLSFEKWFELKARGGHASSPPVSLRVAASATIPSSAQKVFTMVRMTEPFSLKSCLLPHSIKDQNMSSWTRFVYDCGTELIRIQIREHKAKNGMTAFRELVGALKSPKKQFQLAEFKENKWTLKDSDLSISHGTDDSLLDLKGDNQLVKLYRGRKLEYERKCCSAHSEDVLAVTAVKFCAEHPYGKAVALLDTESLLIMVNEDWFLLPWITISVLFMDADDKDSVKLIGGAMVQTGSVFGSDSSMVLETQTVGAGSVKTAPPQCGICSKAFSGGSCGPVVAEDSKADDAKSGGCGSGCGGGCGGTGGCGTMLKASTMASEGQQPANSAGCGSGCGGGCGGAGGCGTMLKASTLASEGQQQANSAGCGSGCGGSCGGAGGFGTMLKASTMASESPQQAKSAGCGSGCGGGCGGGGGCGTMLKASTIASEAQQQAKSAGCGSGCGGGCGGAGGCGTMLKASTMASEAQQLVNSAGCGSGCGGGCGGGGGCGTMLKASAMASEGQQQVNSAGCGSGCGGGGGCGSGMVVIEGSKAKNSANSAAGCGSGCGGGGGCGTLFNSSTAAGEHLPKNKSAGCGSGCGGGCGSGMAIEGSKTNHASKSGGCGSGCGGGCGSGTLFSSGTVTDQGRQSRSADGGCGSGCGGGGCGGGGMIAEGSSNGRLTKSGGCGSGCGGGCGGGGCGGGCGTVFIFKA